MTAGNIGPFDVDVVIPVRNGARYIAYALDSVMAQTNPARSVFVVDYNSSDGTPDIVESYVRRWPRLQLVRAVKRGLSHGRNLGVTMSTAPFVAFLDSDDVWEPTKLERQMALFSEAGSRIGFIHCSYYQIDAQGRRIEGSNDLKPRKRADLLRDLLVEGNIISGSGSAVVVRRELLQNAGGFDERLTYAEDWDAWLRLANVCDVDFVLESLVGIRVHDESMQRRVYPGREEQFFFQRLLILDRWCGHSKFPLQLREQYRREASAIAVSSGSVPTRLRNIEDFYFKLRDCDSRFGRELFRSAAEFKIAAWLSRVTRLRSRMSGFLRSLLRPQATKAKKIGLSTNASLGP